MTSFPSAAPTMSVRPSAFPSAIISPGPSALPSLEAVSSRPSPGPSVSPSLAPSHSPKPSAFPSLDPTQLPSLDPSSLPSMLPSTLPTSAPSANPSRAPSAVPSSSPTAYAVGFDVLGSSGKFSVSTRHTETVIQIDSLYEIDSNGDPVGTSGSSKHSLQTFASQEFVFGDPYEAPYDLTVGGEGIGPNASILPFTSTISDTIGQIDLTTFIFKEPGTVTTDGSEEETLDVSAGDFKWNIELSNWSFCGVDVECKQGQTQQLGAGVDVTMEMKGSGNAIERSNGRKVELGGGVEVFVSKMLYCDDEWIPMESGYPLFTVQGSKQLWTIRFPRFNSTCTYDPLLNSGAVLAEEAATSSPSLLPSTLPSLQVETGQPSEQPSELPSELPSAFVSASPSLGPTASASNSPSSSPTAYEVEFDVIGQSGKFKVSTRRSNVTVAIDSLHEVDSSGDPVGTAGTSKHSIQTFANQEFVFGDPYEAPYGGEGPMASTLPFASSVSDIGTIHVETFIFREDGSITTDGSPEETANITSNDFKFNVKLSDWSFCGVHVDCKKGQTFETGDGIIVTIEIKGTSDDTLASSDLRSYELGGGIEMFVSKMLFCDGEWIPMEPGYPLFAVQGSKQLMSVKVPRFNSSCTYDPLLNTGAVLKEEAAADDNDGDDETSGALLAGRLGLHHLIVGLFSTLLYLAA